MSLERDLPQSKTSRHVPTWRNLSLPFGLFKGGALPPGRSQRDGKWAFKKSRKVSPLGETFRSPLAGSPAVESYL
jgi:hypothetical protein